MPPELLNQIESFIEENKYLGYTTREEFIRDAVRWRLRFLKEEYEYIEIPKGEYEKLQQAIKELETPFLSVNDFIEHQIKTLLDKYEEWTSQKEDYKRKSRIEKLKCKIG